MSKYGISRVTRSKDQARSSYNRISRWYDLMAGGFEGRGIRAGLKRLGVGSGEIVVEIGCGTGNGTLALAKSVGVAGKIYGVDIAERMLEITRRKIVGAGWADRVELVRGDAADLPFADGLADAVFISFALELFDTTEIPIVLRECRRVLKAAGRIGVVGLTKAGQHRAVTRLYEWAHRLMPRLVDCRPIYVRRSLEKACFSILSVSFLPLAGLTAEIVLAGKER